MWHPLGWTCLAPGGRNGRIGAAGACVSVRQLEVRLPYPAGVLRSAEVERMPSP